LKADAIQRPLVKPCKESMPGQNLFCREQSACFAEGIIEERIVGAEVFCQGRMPVHDYGRVAHYAFQDRVARRNVVKFQEHHIPAEKAIVLLVGYMVDGPNVTMLGSSVARFVFMDDRTLPSDPRPRQIETRLAKAWWRLQLVNGLRIAEEPPDLQNALVRIGGISFLGELRNRRLGGVLYADCRHTQAILKPVGQVLRKGDGQPEVWLATLPSGRAENSFEVPIGLIPSRHVRWVVEDADPGLPRIAFLAKQAFVFDIVHQRDAIIAMQWQ